MDQDEQKEMSDEIKRLLDRGFDCCLFISHRKGGVGGAMGGTRADLSALLVALMDQSPDFKGIVITALKALKNL